MQKLSAAFGHFDDRALPVSSDLVGWADCEGSLVPDVTLPLGILVTGSPEDLRETDDPLQVTTGHKWLVTLRVAQVVSPSHYKSPQIPYLIATIGFEPCNHLPWDEDRLKELLDTPDDRPNDWTELLLLRPSDAAAPDTAVDRFLALEHTRLATRVPHADRFEGVPLWAATKHGANLREEMSPTGTTPTSKPLTHRLQRLPHAFLGHLSHIIGAGRSTERATATAALLHELPALRAESHSKGRPVGWTFPLPTADVYWSSRSRRDDHSQADLSECIKLADMVKAVQQRESNRPLPGGSGDFEFWQRNIQRAAVWEPLLVPFVDLGLAAPNSPADTATESRRYLSRWLRSQALADILSIFKELDAVAWVQSPFLHDWTRGAEERRPFFYTEVALAQPSRQTLAWVQAMGGVVREEKRYAMLTLGGFAESEDAFKQWLRDWQKDTGVEFAFPWTHADTVPAPVSLRWDHGVDDPWGARFAHEAQAVATPVPGFVEGAGTLKEQVLAATETGRWTDANLAKQFGVTRQEVGAWVKAAKKQQVKAAQEAAWRAMAAELLRESPKLSVRKLRARLVEVFGEAAPGRSTLAVAMKEMRGG